MVFGRSKVPAKAPCRITVVHDGPGGWRWNVVYGSMSWHSSTDSIGSANEAWIDARRALAAAQQKREAV